MDASVCNTQKQPSLPRAWTDRGLGWIDKSTPALRAGSHFLVHRLHRCRPADLPGAWHVQQPIRPGNGMTEALCGSSKLGSAQAPIDGGNRPSKRPLDMLRYTGYSYWLQPHATVCTLPSSTVFRRNSLARALPSHGIYRFARLFSSSLRRC